MARNKYMEEDELNFDGQAGFDPFSGGMDFEGTPGVDPFSNGMDFSGMEGQTPMEFGGDEMDFSGMDYETPMEFGEEPMDFSGYGGPTPSMDMGYGEPQMGYDFGGMPGQNPMEIDTRQSVSNPIFGGSRGSAIGEEVAAPADMFETGRDRLAHFLLRMSQQQPASPQLPSMEEVDARFRRGR